MTAGVPLPDAPPISVAKRVAFHADGVAFTVADLARRAGVGGRESLLTAPGPVPAHQVEEAFRRARGLLRADQLETWLSSWAIEPDDFRRWTLDVGAGTGTASAWCTLLCSGTFDRTVAEVVAAVAAACALGSPPSDAAGFEPSGWVERLVATGTTEEALAATVAANRLDWTELRAVEVLIPGRSTAEELRHQVLGDGVALDVAGPRAGCPARVIESTLAAIAPTEVRAALAGARPEEVVGPLPVAGSWALVEVRGRREPTLADATTRSRAEAAVRNDLIARAVARHVVA